MSAGERDLAPDFQACAELARQAAAGDTTASRRLVELLWSWWQELVARSRRVRPLPDREELARDVAVSLAERLTDPGRQQLALYVRWQEGHPDKSFGDWMRIVAANATRDALRARFGRQSRGPREAEGKSCSCPELSCDCLVVGRNGGRLRHPNE